MSNDLDVPVLILVGGALDGTKFSVDDAEPKTLGTSSDCDFPIRLENVAERHAQLVWNAGALAISDLGSKTGVYVNGEKLEGERLLEQGDRVCLGPPGSKQSAKLLVKLPEPTIETGDEGFSLEEGESVSLVPVDLSLDEEAPQIHPDLAASPEVPSTQAAPKPPPPPPVPVSTAGEEDLLVIDEPQAATHEPLIPIPDDAASAETPKARTPSTIPLAPERPDYQTAPPSIAPIEPAARGESGAAPRPQPAARPLSPRPVARPRGRSRGLPRIPPVALWGGGAAVALIVLAVVVTRFIGPAPAVAGVLPPKLEVGQTVTISGTHFAADVVGNAVRIGDKTGTIMKASAEEIVAAVPELGAGTFPLVVEARGKTSNAVNVTIAPIPRIRQVDPDVALPGQAVTLRGANLAASAPSVTVGGAAAKVLEAQDDSLRINVPSVAAAEGEFVPVVVKVGTESSRPVMLRLGRLPLLDSVTPNQGGAGQRVVLKGRGFSATPAENLVRFGSESALVLTAAPTELTALVATPYGTLSQFRVGVTVTVGNSTSVERAFTIEQQPTGMFLPGFYAAAPPAQHAGHEHAVVATAIAPVLLLSGKGGAGSAAERAETVARALNDVFATAEGGSVAIESRDSPPAVAVAGRRDPIVLVTSEDAAGMAETWVGAQGAKLGAQGLARYWAALLSDYLALFAARQRPVSTVQLSPEGKVFLDIYSQAARRTGTPMGVPTAMLSPLPAPWAETLQHLAYTTPAAGTAARADTAVEGTWSGSMRDGDSPQRLDVEIVRTGGRLGGTVKIQKGALVVKSPLADVSFQGGMLRFTIAVGAGERRCEGKLQGDTIAGTIKNASGQATGEFSIRFTD